MNEAALREGTATLLARFETEPAHTLHVARLALELFDQLGTWHGHSLDERLILEAAATLHDTGWSQTQPDGSGHHKASAKLIREHPWVGLAAREIELIALVARYHRRALPSADHEPYSAQSETDRRRVRRLAALLRVADGLDRQHLQDVDGVEATVSDEGIEIVALARRNVNPAIVAAFKKADLLELEAGRAVHVLQRLR